tara:strand:+ start:39215 stop:39421 length:207 start_codon:yes stop_codon:yes gene_type:complete
MTLSHNDRIELDELRKDKAIYENKIAYLEQTVRSYKIEINCLRNNKLSPAQVKQETIRRLKDGLPTQL